MSMYLPNPGLHPTGSEPAEFIDLPAMAHEVTGETGPAPGSGDDGKRAAAVDADTGRPPAWTR
jgi:hypothetical protein